VSELLRATLDAGKQQEIRLADELELVERYLDIERIRLGDRLRTQIDAELATRNALVPMFILQPIVENAVRHAIAPRTAPGTIAISTRREDDELQIEIADDGGGFAADAIEGVGLTNTRARLAHLYGDKQRIEIVRSAAGGASVRLVLPFEHDARPRSDRRGRAAGAPAAGAFAAPPQRHRTRRQRC
jgi:LytS/YehU family sensor histidine kinase